MEDLDWKARKVEVCNSGEGEEKKKIWNKTKSERKKTIPSG